MTETSLRTGQFAPVCRLKQSSSGSSRSKCSLLSAGLGSLIVLAANASNPIMRDSARFLIAEAAVEGWPAVGTTKSHDNVQLAGLEYYLSSVLVVVEARTLVRCSGTAPQAQASGNRTADLRLSLPLGILMLSIYLLPPSSFVLGPLQLLSLLIHLYRLFKQAFSNGKPLWQSTKMIRLAAMILLSPQP